MRKTTAAHYREKTPPPRLIGVAAALLCLVCSSAFAAGVDGLGTSAEYIVGFVRYVHWRAEDSAETWRICIVGDVPADQDRTYANEVVRGKNFAVRHIDASDKLDGCHVVDMTAIEPAVARALLMRMRRLPILTVGRGSDFCSDGGQFCLHLQDRDQKFEVNLSAVREAGLSVSSRLLMIGSTRTAREPER